jgi:hypothetical protein
MEGRLQWKQLKGWQRWLRRIVEFQLIESNGQLALSASCPLAS